MKSRLALTVLAAAIVVGITGIGAAAQTRAARPFDHDRHESISCGSCHGVGGQHREMLIRGPRDCAACHHDASRQSQCTSCHSADQLDRVTGAVTVFKLSVGNTALPRTLPFAHTRHSRVACTVCHATPVTLERSRDCASCHQQHHRAEASCSGCHPTPQATAHPVEAHLTCAASQCHAARVAPEPTLSRTLCLVCHTDRSGHEPAVDCAGCHKIPDKETAAAVLRGDAR